MLCKCIILGTMPITQTNAGIINPLTLNIKEQIVLSFPHTFLIKYWGHVIKISRDFTLGDHILNSHDLRGGRSIDITRRNLMLITVTNTIRVRIILVCLLCMPNRFLAMLC